MVGERCQEEPHINGVEQAAVNYTLDVEVVSVGERCQVLVQEPHVKGVKQAVVNFTLDVEVVDVGDRCQVLVQEPLIKGMKQAMVNHTLVSVTGENSREKREVN